MISLISLGLALLVTFVAVGTAEPTTSGAAPINWVDVIDATPIPLVLDLRTIRHRQMIQQVRQWVFRPVESH
jgi:hypothetical protein